MSVEAGGGDVLPLGVELRGEDLPLVPLQQHDGRVQVGRSRHLEVE